MRFRSARVLALTVGLLVAYGGTAHADPPGNDTYQGRTVIGSLPFVEQVDTSEATQDTDDNELAGQCAGVPAWDATVWYEVTATTDGTLIADGTASGYSTGFFVAIGGPGAFTLLACAPGVVQWVATAGQTYTLVAFDDQTDGSGTGGILNLVVDTPPPPPPPPTIDITVDPVARFDNRTGAATVTGTAICTDAPQFAFLQTTLRQTVGRFTITGINGTNLTCDGTATPWSLQIIADNGLFRGGKAATITFAIACGVLECGQDLEERTISLRGGKP